MGAKRNGQLEPANFGEPVLVQCSEFRCLAYRDRRGNWRTFFRDEVLSGAVVIVDTYG